MTRTSLVPLPTVFLSDLNKPEVTTPSIMLQLWRSRGSSTNNDRIVAHRPRNPRSSRHSGTTRGDSSTGGSGDDNRSVASSVTNASTRSSHHPRRHHRSSRPSGSPPASRHRTERIEAPPPQIRPESPEPSVRDPVADWLTRSRQENANEAGDHLSRASTIVGSASRPNSPISYAPYNSDSDGSNDTEVPIANYRRRSQRRTEPVDVQAMRDEIEELKAELLKASERQDMVDGTLQQIAETVSLTGQVIQDSMLYAGSHGNLSRTGRQSIPPLSEEMQNEIVTTRILELDEQSRRADNSMETLNTLCEGASKMDSLLKIMINGAERNVISDEFDTIDRKHAEILELVTEARQENRSGSVTGTRVDIHPLKKHGIPALNRIRPLYVELDERLKEAENYAGRGSTSIVRSGGQSQTEIKLKVAMRAFKDESRQRDCGTLMHAALEKDSNGCSDSLDPKTQSWRRHL